MKGEGTSWSGKKGKEQGGGWTSSKIYDIRVWGCHKEILYLFWLYYLCVCMPVCAGPGHTWKREEHFVLLVLSFHLHMASGDGSQQVTRPREQAPLLAKHLHCPVLLLCFVFRDKIWCYSPDCPQPLCSPHASFSHVLGYKCGQHCAQERNHYFEWYIFIF